VSQAERRSGSTHRRAKKKEFTAGAPLIPEGRRRSSPQGLHSSRREEEGVHRRGSTHRGGKKKGFTAEDAEDAEKKGEELTAEDAEERVWG